MKKYISILAAAAVLMLSGCTSGSVVTEVSNASNASEVSETSAASQDAEGTSEGAPGASLTAADIRDGSYEITVDSSSTMFNSTKCTLNVSDGKMTAVMTMQIGRASCREKCRCRWSPYH